MSSSLESIANTFVPYEVRRFTEAHERVVRQLQANTEKAEATARDVVAVHQGINRAHSDGRVGSLLDIYA